MEIYLFLEQIKQLRQAVHLRTPCAVWLVPRLLRAITLLYGDPVRLVMTFAHAGFQPFLEDPAVNADWPRLNFVLWPSMYVY